MKIQCSCGVKYSFEVTPEMGAAPRQFVCQNCGADNSAVVNHLIGQELGLTSSAVTSGGPNVAPPPTPETVQARGNASSAKPGPPLTQSERTASRAGGAAPLRVSLHNPSAGSEPAPGTESPPLCLKHPGQMATHRCLVCQKPICPKCVEVMGFVCSALCKAKAEREGLTLPSYAHGKSALQAKEWRTARLVTSSIVGLGAAVLGVWFWYAWFGSVPKPAFSVRFQEAAYSGQCRVLPGNQIVFLHGGTLARYDLKTKKEIWSQSLIDQKKIAEQAATSLDEMTAAREKARKNGSDLSDSRMPPTLPELIRDLQRQATGALRLHLRGQSIWISYAHKLVRYDWQTGQPAQEIPLSDSFNPLVSSGDELLEISAKEGAQTVTHFNLLSGATRTEEIAARASARIAGAAGANRPSQASPKPLDPKAVANRAQNLPLASRLALPAVLAANANQQRLLSEMRDPPETGLLSRGSRLERDERTSLIPDGETFVQFSVKLIESKLIERQAMKAPPKKSALDGDVNASSTGAVANEILNEMQRDRGGDVVTEDASRYQVTLRRPGDKAAAEWVGEVVGAPELFPARTVNVLAAGKSIWVFDKTNKKIWESKLNYPMTSGSRDFLSSEMATFGEGPVVDRGDTLYLFDQGVFTAFELASGNPRWRLPLVGISGLLFDDKGIMYVNASSASQDILKYPNQIDISEKAKQVVLKLNARTGATLWRLEQEGLVSYVSGKFIYSTVTYAGDLDEEGGSAFGVKTGLEMPPHIRIKRLDPANGRVLWEHYQNRMPLDVRFEKNTIQLLFKKELQVLKFFSL